MNEQEEKRKRRQKKLYKARREAGTIQPRTFVSADETCAQLRRLISHKRDGGRFSVTFISEETGVARNYLYKLTQKNRATPTINQDIADTIRAFYDQWIDEGVHQVKEGLRHSPGALFQDQVSTALSRRALQGLQAQGYSQQELADLLETAQAHIWRILAGKQHTVLESFEARILELVRSIGSKTSDNPRASIAIRAAEAKGWKPTMYDDRLV